MTKKIGIILGIILTVLLMCSTINYAVNDTTGIYLGLKGKSTSRETGKYTFNNKDVFKIVKYNNTSGTAEVGDNTSIYCIKGGPGFGSESYQNTIVNYTQYFDVKAPKNIEEPYRSELPTDMKRYNELVWVLDHIYIPAKTGASSEEIALANESKENLLNNAGVAKDSFLRNQVQYGKEIEDILESIQQIAIWYFTNPDGPYHNNSEETVEIAVNGVNLSDKYHLDLVDNEIDQVYSYLVKGAIEAVKNGYTYENSGIGTSPINFIKDSATVNISGSDYIVGPYKIEEKTSAEYNLSATITNGTNNIENAKILNANKEEVLGNTLADKIKQTVGKNFYISIPMSSNITQVKLSIGAESYTTSQTMWTTGQASLTNNQPVVIVSREKQKYEDESIVKIKNPEFDLALRKFITQINGKNVETREPAVSQEDLKALATGNAKFDNGTTVTKNHKKTPLIVEKNDIVTYTIRVYNEGDIDGYAKEIVDYLPSGLELVDQSQSTINKKYGWIVKDKNDVRTAVSTTYIKDELISKFEKDPTDGKYKLDYVDVQIECKVIKSPSEHDVSLKNVAEITNAVDSNGNSKDRDSQTNNLTEEQTNNYLPGTSEEGKGYQDDDDYEELKMLGKYFDLSLRKFITGINDKR